MGKIIRNGIEYCGTSDTADNIIYDNTDSGLESTTTQGAIDELSEKVKIVYLTQEQYDNLPDSKLTDNVEYRVTDAGTMAGAENVGYDNTISGLAAVNVQDAIDKLDNRLSVIFDKVNIKRYHIGNGQSVSIQFNMDAFVLCGYSMSKGGFFIARMTNGSSNAYIEEIGTVPTSISITVNGNVRTITNNIGWNIQVFVIS